MNDHQAAPFEILQRMQQQAAAAGYVLPELSAAEERWNGLGFVVGDLKLVAEMTAFTDIVDCGSLTPVPRTRDWVRGITNVRGSLISVVDFAAFLGFTRVNTEAGGKLLVVNDSDLGCALLVNAVIGIRRFDVQHERHDIAATVSGPVTPFLDRAYQQDGESWGVLDTQKLIASEVFRGVDTE